MKYAIISDTHGNFEALKKVLEDIRKNKVDKIISLGDVVGYGPKPHECIDALRRKKVVSLMGNHEAGVLGQTNLELWRFEARMTWDDARKKLTNADIEWLLSRPLYYFAEDFVCVHGSPNGPTLEYIENSLTIRRQLKLARICFNGHTHQPKMFVNSNQMNIKPVNELKSKCSYFINPGSVGQPRDGDPRSSYIIYDVEKQTITMKSVEYNIEETQRQIREAGYPELLASRLSCGW